MQEKRKIDGKIFTLMRKDGNLTKAYAKDVAKFYREEDAWFVRTIKGANNKYYVYIRKKY